MQVHLHDPIVRARRLHHGAAFGDGVADGLLHVDVRARFARGDGNQRMPVVGRGDDDDFGFLFRQQLTIVLVAHWPLA